MQMWKIRTFSARTCGTNEYEDGLLRISGSGLNRMRRFSCFSGVRIRSWLKTQQCFYFIFFSTFAQNKVVVRKWLPVQIFICFCRRRVVCVHSLPLSSGVTFEGLITLVLVCFNCLFPLRKHIKSLVSQHRPGRPFSFHILFIWNSNPQQ